MVTYTKTVTFHKCERCHHEWQRRWPTPPKVCPRCKRANWNVSPEAHAKGKTRALTTAAIRRGEIKKMPCEICGNEKTEPHHEDYNDFMKIKWLCLSHHRKLHWVERKARGKVIAAEDDM